MLFLARRSFLLGRATFLAAATLAGAPHGEVDWTQPQLPLETKEQKQGVGSRILTVALIAHRSASKRCFTSWASRGAFLLGLRNRKSDGQIGYGLNRQHISTGADAGRIWKGVRSLRSLLRLVCKVAAGGVDYWPSQCVSPPI